MLELLLEVTRLVALIYVRFLRSLRNVEDLLVARSIDLMPRDDPLLV